MAKLEVPNIILDPDFCDDATLIRRASTVNEYGEQVLSETEHAIKLVVQKVLPETLSKLPEAARLSQLITVYYKGELQVEGQGEYADVIVIDGYRYEAISIDDGFSSLPQGYTAATCALQVVSE